jgi:hypothetical protein
MNSFSFTSIYVSKYPPADNVDEIEKQKLDQDQVMAEHYYILKHSELNNWKSQNFYHEAFLTSCVCQVKYEFKLLTAKLTSGRLTMIYYDLEKLLEVNSCIEITLNYLISLSPIPNVTMLKESNPATSFEALETIDDNIQSMNKMLDLNYFLICPNRLEVYANTRTTLKMILQICKPLN